MFDVETQVLYKLRIICIQVWKSKSRGIICDRSREDSERMVRGFEGSARCTIALFGRLEAEALVD